MNYLSKEGYESLDAELRVLKTKGRRDIAGQIADARAQGDLSEMRNMMRLKKLKGILRKKLLN